MLLQLATSFQLFTGIMRIVLDVNDDKAAFFLEIVRNFSFVKFDRTSSEQSQMIEDLKGAVDEVNRAKRGELKLQSARDFLNEL
jgi:hypothetical protein